MVQLRLVSITALVFAGWCCGAEPPRKVDPTFLHRFLPAVDAITEGGCSYKALFGDGDREHAAPKGIARFGELTLVSGARCKPVNEPAEEQVYVIIRGNGALWYAGDTVPLKRHDFVYLPAGVEHGVANSSSEELHLFLMGFRIPAGVPPPPKLLIANYDDVPLQNVSGHPDSVQYRLMMGGVQSRRDRIAAGHLLTSLFLMDFAPGGTNFPHHHDSEEEIYVLLDGQGEIVAGSGMDGIEGRFPAKPGDAYFFRLNCT